MKVSDVVTVLESLAPPSLATKWDNVGLLIGDEGRPAGRLMLCIDLTEPVLAEAIASKVRMVMAYHPVIFKDVSRVTRSAQPVVYEAARRGIAVYSMHTALDAAPGGTHDVLAGVLGLEAPAPLEPVDGAANCKIVVFVAPDHVAAVSRAAFDAGAGRIGDYTQCSFRTGGIGTFRGGAATNPTVGKAGQFEQAEELRLEVIAPCRCVAGVVAAVRAAHSYEEPAIDVYPLAPALEGHGMGRIGPLRRPAAPKALIERVKRAAKLTKLLVASAGRDTVTTAAVAAGACGSLYKAAVAAGATFYLTGEMRHHDALAAAAAGMTVVCMGHSNSERITLPVLKRRIRKALPALDVVISRRDRDPFQIV